MKTLVYLILTLFAPAPDFAYSCEGLTCKFLETSDLWQSDQFWDFGDDWCSWSPDPWYIYDRPGTYTVTLTTSGGTVSHPVLVNEASQPTRTKGRK